MTWITVDVDLNEIDDADIEAEYNSRGLGDQPSESEDKGELMAIRQLVLTHKSKEAYRRMYDYIRNRLGTAI
ncbi:hypothetical protein [Flavobacterium sp.]|jgi:hypothetical protein|uniref:hypothetical protein n=1 Tax=Flavobacterium sp. TaxID=239 RepID=UPI0037BE7DBB